MTTKRTEALEIQIERLVREHLAAQERAAAAAVVRAFGDAMPARQPASRVGRKFVRRPAAKMDELVERLWDAVRASPGETMTVFAERVGETPRALNRPMFRLKRLGHVRSAGERNRTRYFPMAGGKSA